MKVRSRTPIGSRSPDVRTERNTVDVRGMRVHEAEAALEERLRAANGPVWAIHGIGTGKKRWLGVTRSDAEILTMRALKQHLDPRGILNPGRVI